MSAPVGPFLVYVMMSFLAIGVMGDPAYAQEATGPQDIVVIGKTAVSVPQGRVLLVRKGSDYCALKFTDWWVARSAKDKYHGKDWWSYSCYQAWYQGDGTGDFATKNVEFKENDLFNVRHFEIGRLVLDLASDKVEVRCGPIKLMWGTKGSVHFFKLGQSTSVDKIRKYGIELAPTPWKDISEVNVKDSRIRWHVYDEKRATEVVPMDKLWGDEGGE